MMTAAISPPITWPGNVLSEVLSEGLKLHKNFGRVEPGLVSFSGRYRAPNCYRRGAVGDGWSYPADRNAGGPCSFFLKSTNRPSPRRGWRGCAV
jgi:hypothetical protein